MKKKMRNLFAALFLFSVSLSFSQEQLFNLYSNPVLEKKWKEFPANLKISPLLLLSSLPLPFKDDFSIDSAYPNPAKWQDMKVFINRNLPVAPPTVGVATFDGLGADGLPYDTSGTFGNSNSAYADALTSQPINLSTLMASDSVYFSFAYQGGGHGNLPETNDSLWLEFKSPLQAWTKIWATPGFSAPPPDSNFKQVMIYISSPTLLSDSFQFRFRNKATISGNFDHWNLDNVYLNNGRTAADTAQQDIAFVYDAPSMLNQYMAMPWNQYQVTDMKSSIKNFLRNNFDTTFTTSTYAYQIKDMQNNVLSGISGAFSLQQYYPFGYTTCAAVCSNIFDVPVNTPPVNYSYPDTLTECYIYHVVHSLSPIDFEPNNDTITFYQQFLNYYAYDDGTAEKGYGLNVIGAQLAYKFTLNKPDTLKAVDMFFTFLDKSKAQRAFRLTIWNDAGGLPGTIIYQDSIVSPVYENAYNKFHRYFITNPNLVVSGTFYVGWVQYAADELNIGFDVNTNAKANMYFRTGATWNQTIFNGSWMIRPVLNTCSNVLSVNENNVAPASPFFTAYPNPANDVLFIKLNPSEERQSGKKTLFVSDILGNTLIRIHDFSGNPIDISPLSNGIYFIRIADKNGISGVAKFAVSK